ncbi:MAG: glucuronate isomerase [Clostridiales bacterium]|nr:glucuronate isomerase [Clostridiales bacterium]
MKEFMDRDFLLTSNTSKHLYHDVAARLPIIDYHCHLPVSEICENRSFDNITQLWLGGDHYKWRLMRACGVDERYITGSAPDREKFQKWAETLALAIGNPLYHWSHLELKRYFGYEGILNGETAETVWKLCNEKLRQAEWSARGLILRSGVEALCTTDDPADDLEYHRRLAEDESFTVKVLPGFRPDRALSIEKKDFPEYLGKMGAIQSFDDLKQALIGRLDYFISLGCRVADCGLAAVPYAPASDEEINRIFRKRLEGVNLSDLEVKQYKTALLLALGQGYAERNIVMQLHFGVMRDNSSRLLMNVGCDAGGDAIGDRAPISELASFLDALDAIDKLPKTILYSLDPGDNASIDALIGCFQRDCFGKLQHGSAWWFNDHKRGMEDHLDGLAESGMLAAFVGMLTDSRSFLSYARHEYFRRILCEFVGRRVENGEFPCDEAALQKIVSGACYLNAKRYFRLED